MPAAAKRKQTTNEFYRSVLDDAVREEWLASEKKPTKKKMDASRRLSSLYGCNIASKHVQRRTSVAVKPGGLAPMQEALNELTKRKSISEVYL